MTVIVDRKGDRVIIKVKCPKCGYSYTLELLEAKEHELCPMCGCFDRIENFQR